MILAIDLIIVVCCLIMLVDFYRGSIVFILSSLLIPEFVAFQWGTVNLNINDAMLLCMLVSFGIHKSKLTSRFSIKKILKMLTLYVLPSVIVFLFSSYVPKDVQFYELAKNVFFHFVVPVVILFYAFNKKETEVKFIKGLAIVATIIGIYGVVCYLIKANPYMQALNLLYYNDYLYEYFISEVRGGLSGRVSGTVNHPLTWGQLWGILLAFFVMVKDKVNPWLFKAILVFGCLNVVFSGSRSALVALFPILIGYAVSSGGFKVIRKIAMYAIVAITMSYAISEKMQSYIESAIFFWDESKSDAANISGSGVDMRISQMETTLFDVGKENIFTGYGLGYLEYSKKKNLRNKDMLGFESVFFQKMYEQGVIGFVCFLGFMFQFFSFGSKRFTRDKRILYLGYCSSYLVSILFTGIQNTFGWFIYLGIVLVLFNDSFQTSYILKNKK